MTFNIIKPRPLGLVFDRTPSGLVKIHGNVCAVLFRDGIIQDVLETTNIITDAGDLFYAYRATNAQPPTTHFTDGAALTFDGIMELYTSVSAAPSKSGIRSSLTSGIIATGSGKAMASGYPKRNDTDTANTGKGTDVVTYKVAYLTSEANAVGIDDVVITNPSPSAGDNLLMWADALGSFTKTSSNELNMYVNHTINGV